MSMNNTNVYLYISAETGENMKILNIGIATGHSPGEFCSRRTFAHYTVSCFATMYRYEKNCEILSGGIGDIVINTPGVTVYHGDFADDGGGFVNDWMYIDSDEMSELLKKYPVPLNIAVRTGNKYFLRSYMNNIYDEMIMKKIGCGDMIQSIITQMIIDLHRVSHNETAADKDRLAKARYAIIKNPEKEHTVESLAKLCGYSPGRFSHLYRDTYGITPMQSVINKRINMAKSLLEYGGLLVSDVAAACGFANIYYFSKCFKEKTGVAPSEYKKTQRRKKFYLMKA